MRLPVPLQVKDSTVSDNTVKGATYVGGGGIGQFAGTLTVIDSTISGNRSQEGTAGGIGAFAAVTVSGTTISGNFAGGVGGGAIAMANGTLEITDATISDNSTTASGGGIASDAATIRLNNVTMAGNTADSDRDGIGDGGGLATAGALVSMSNTIIADNVDTGGEAPDCIGPIDSRGHNLIENTAACALVGGPADITGQDPKLGPLTNNGGPTETRALLRGSPAIDAGNPATPGSGGNACEATDQRGVARPQDGDADGVATCDIGAFERSRPR